MLDGSAREDARLSNLLSVSNHLFRDYKKPMKMKQFRSLLSASRIMIGRDETFDEYFAAHPFTGLGILDSDDSIDYSKYFGIPIPYLIPDWLLMPATVSPVFGQCWFLALLIIKGQFVPSAEEQPLLRFVATSYLLERALCDSRNHDLESASVVFNTPRQ